MRSEVHKESQQQPSPPPQGEGTTTNTRGPSYSNRDGEVEMLREQMALLQRNTKKDKELLCRKDKELHHQRGPSPASSHSRANKHILENRNKKRDRISTHPHGEREQSPYREKVVSPPHHKSRRGEQDGDNFKGPIPQCLSVSHSQVPVMP